MTEHNSPLRNVGSWNLLALIRMEKEKKTWEQVIKEFETEFPDEDPRLWQAMRDKPITDDEFDDFRGRFDVT